MKAISTVLCLLALPTLAQEPLSGWAVHSTDKSYDALVADTKTAVKENGLIVVTQAGPTKAAAARGIIIPGNLVIGAFNNDYAVRVLESSVDAMIEAPIRFYVTENADGTATLSYKTPSHVFAPYAQQGGEPLQEIATELDEKFQAVAESAVN
ncbi:DUF302 domain-containing protein [Ruegeria atlantica]|uniref:DUF302 domain-containing protein n=1 Tax=Ruegeria atlantica TaxID=81569 RepID=UPI002493F33B|nr:DUF302 domain-containing protein [Ruegeria atlantica]